MSGKNYIIVLLSCIGLAASASAPFITKCKWDDSNCIKENTQKTIPLFANGIPDLNVEQMDPLKLKEVDATSPNLKLIVTDLTVVGLKDCEANKIERDIENSKILVNIQCNCNVEAKYDMKGQLFVLPIEGNGDLHVKVRKLVIDAEVNLADKTGKDGKKHWNVKSFKHTFELKDKSEVKFDNLFPDNEFLRKNVNDVIDKSGNDVIKEIGAPIIKAVVTKVVENIKKFFAAVPVEELALD